MIEILILSFLVLFCVIADKYKILNLLFFLLPFHSFIKSSLSFIFGGGNMFSAWKEMAIIIFFYKVLKDTHFKTSKNLFFLIGGFFFLSLVYYLLANNYVDALATLRNHVFPIILFFALSICPLTIENFKKLIIVFSVALLINGLMGFVQFFLLKIPIALVMGRIDFINKNGYIQYKTVSARIMGFERMTGILGGPNEFGVFNSFGISLLAGSLIVGLKNFLNKNQIKLIKTAITLSIICLLLSFSRAGWAISILSTYMILRMKDIPVATPKRILSLLIILIFGYLLIILFVPFVNDILINTFSGKEASAADRGNSFIMGLEKNITEPFGHGLGTADNRSNKEFFVESAFMNIAYEIGIIGLLYLVFFHFMIIKTMYLKKFREFNPFTSVAIAISISSVIACLVSVNPYGMPYIYLWWSILGLGLNKSFYNTLQNE